MQLACAGGIGEEGGRLTPQQLHPAITGHLERDLSRQLKKGPFQILELRSYAFLPLDVALGVKIILLP